MSIFYNLLTLLQAAIAVASARDRSMPMFFIGLWNRVGRMRTRLEKLLVLWRAGMLPLPRERASRAGEPRDGRVKTITMPSNHGWLLPRVRDAAKFGAMLEAMLTQEEIVRFLDEVPAARRIVGVLKRMLIVPPGKPVPTMQRAEVWPPPAWQEAGMHLGPTGRLEWN